MWHGDNGRAVGFGAWRGWGLVWAFSALCLVAEPTVTPIRGQTPGAARDAVRWTPEDRQRDIARVRDRFLRVLAEGRAATPPAERDDPDQTGSAWWQWRSESFALWLAQDGDDAGAETALEIVPASRRAEPRGKLPFLRAERSLKSGDLAGARARAEGLSGFDRDRILLAIADAQMAAGNEAAARKTAADVSDADLRKSVIRRFDDARPEKQILDRLRAGDPEGATKPLETLADSYYRADRLYEVAEALWRKGERAKATALWDSVPAATVEPPAAGEDYEQATRRELAGLRLGPLAKSRARAGDHDGAVRTVLLARDLALRLRLLLDVAVAEAKAGHAASSADSFARAAATVRQFRRGDVGMYWAELAHAQVRAGDFAGARASAVQVPVEEFSGIFQPGYCIPRAYSRAITLKYIATEQMKAGDPAGARKTLAAMEGDAEERARDEVTAAEVEARAKSGDFAGARMMAGRMKTPFLRSRAWLSVAGELARRGDLNAARELVTRARADGMTPPEFPEPHPLIAVARAMALPPALGGLGDLSAADNTAKRLSLEDRATLWSDVYGTLTGRD
jgi:hypothetical protein